MRRGLLVGVVLSVILFTSTMAIVSEGQSWREPRNRIKTYIDSYGGIFYGVVYSLPETRKAFIESVGDRAWSIYSPEYVSGELSFDEKEDVIAAVSLVLEKMTTNDQHKYFERIKLWLAAQKALSYSDGLACIEPTMGAVYSVPETQPLFEWVLKNRGFDPQVTIGIEVGATLASGEISSIKYELLNMLSGLSRKDQMAYFRALFDKLLTDPYLQECLSMPDVDLPADGEQGKN